MPALKNEKSANFKVRDKVYLDSDPPKHSTSSINDNPKKVYVISVIDDTSLEIIDPDNPFTKIKTTVKDISRVEERKVDSKAAKGGRRLVRTRRRSKRRAGTRRRRA